MLRFVTLFMVMEQYADQGKFDFLLCLQLFYDSLSREREELCGKLLYERERNKWKRNSTQNQQTSCKNLFFFSSFAFSLVKMLFKLNFPLSLLPFFLLESLAVL